MKFFNCTASLWSFPHLVSCPVTFSGCLICHFSALPLVHLSTSLSAGPLQPFGKTRIIWEPSENLLSHRLCVSQVIPLVQVGELQVPRWLPNPAVGWRVCGAESTLTSVWGEVLGRALQFCSKGKIQSQEKYLTPCKRSGRGAFPAGGASCAPRKLHLAAWRGWQLTREQTSPTAGLDRAVGLGRGQSLAFAASPSPPPCCSKLPRAEIY